MMVSDGIKEERATYPIADQCSEEVRNTFCPAMMVSVGIKEEREACPIADHCSEEVKNAFCPTEEKFNIVMISDSIKEEQWAYPMTDRYSEEVKNSFCPAEEEFNVVMVSDTIKEERGAFPTADQCSEEVEDASCPARMVEITAFSTNVKKEEEDCSLDHQDSEMRGAITDFIGDPVASFPVDNKTLFHQAMNNEQEKTGALSTSATTSASQPGRPEEVQQVKREEEVLVAGTRATPAAEASQPSRRGIGARLRSQNLTPVVTEYRQPVVLEEEHDSTFLIHQPSPPPNRQRKRRRHHLLLLRSTAIWAQNLRRPHSSSSKDRIMHRILRELALIKRRLQNLTWEMASVRKKLDALIDNFY